MQRCNRWSVGWFLVFLVIGVTGTGWAQNSPELDGNDALEITETDREWWAFQPLRVVDPPRVSRSDWCRTPVDNFILARLEEEGIVPSAALPVNRLVRRLSFDLLGLPPDPARVQDLLENPRPGRFDAMMEEMLSSPRYGERWARYWLDVARFAESHGFEHDYMRPHAYHYRDFVIQALNADMPFDQFVRWQLAGDEIAPENPLALMATGFLGAGVFPTQITANEVERTRYDALDDMASTTSVAFLGLTVGCARCHDHKFDPIASLDYYRMIATFTTTVRSEIQVDLQPERTARALAAFDTEVALQQAALDRYEEDHLETTFDDWLKDHQGRLMVTSPWTVLQVSRFTAESKAKLQSLQDGSSLVTGTNASSDRYRISFDDVPGGTQVIRLEALTHDSMPRKGPGRADNGNFGLSRIRLTIRDKDDRVIANVPVRVARATHQQNAGHLSLNASLDDNDSTGWAVDLGGIGKDQAAVFIPEEPLEPGPGQHLEVELHFAVNTRHNIGRFRFSVGTDPGVQPIVGGGVPAEETAAVRQLNDKGVASLTAEQRSVLFRLYASQDPEWTDLTVAIEKLKSRRPVPSTTTVMICSEGPHVKPMRHHSQGKDFFDETFLLRRGDTDQKIRPVSAGFLQVLLPTGETGARFRRESSSRTGTSNRRTALAEWLTDPETGAGVLLARVFANRIWQHHFGEGLVRTVNDFGVQGDQPSHPELLDYLAGELIRSGWSTRHLHRLILGSATWRQGNRQDAVTGDPENRLWSHRVPRRLEAEAVRDSMLHLGDRMEQRMYGAGSLDSMMRRRAVYFTVKRSQLIPMLQAFDAPEPLVSQGRRQSTTIAPQALVLLNHQLIREAAQGLAERLSATTTASDFVEQGYWLCCGRAPDADEEALGREFLVRQSARYAAHLSGPDADQQARIDFAHALLCLNETIFVD